ncbi:MAG: hypothetical protein WAN46_17715 [Gammaproteobacteria bacterium]|jgi:hypothetical protein
MLKTPKKGKRVRCTAIDGPVPRGTRGTIVEYARKNIYCDAFREMVFVLWDSRKKAGISKRQLEEIIE